MLDVKKKSNLRVINIQAYYEKTKIILQNELYKTAVLKVRYSDGTWRTIFRKIINDSTIEINKYVEEFVSLSLEQMRQILNMITRKGKEIYNLYFLEYLKRNVNSEFESMIEASKEKNVLMRIKGHLLNLENILNDNLNEIEAIRIYTINFESGIHNMCDVIEIKRSDSEYFENIFRCEYNVNDNSNRILVNHKIINHVELSEILSMIEKSEQLQIFQKYINGFVDEKCNHIRRYTKFNCANNLQ